MTVSGVGRLAAASAVAFLMVGMAAAESAADRSLLLESRAGVHRALTRLVELQRPDGSWQGDPAITALAATAMMGSGQEGFGVGGEPVTRALAYVRGFARPDGGIYGKFYPNYTTSICAMALIEAGLEQDRELIRKARSFLLDLQADEGDGITPTDPQYGGWGYEKAAGGEAMHAADLSNTQLALEALRAMEQAAEEDKPESAAGAAHTRTELAYDKALAYLNRCQSDDGGFIYGPGESKAGQDEEGTLRSYGGMTYAGLKSMIYARVGRDDARVSAAYDWARKHWTVTENPGLGPQGLFYYYQTMAKALRVYGRDKVVDARGAAHDWRQELVGQLLKVQRADGTWANDNGRWMEQIPELVTAYSVLAIEQATADWR